MSRSSASDGISKQRYMEEIIRKERDSMIGWYFKSKQRSAQEDPDEEQNKSRQYEVFRKKLERRRLQPSEAQLRLRQKHLELPSIVKVAERTAADEDKTESHLAGANLPPAVLEMEPVDGATMGMLYDGLSSEGRGRHSYLQTRNRLGPDQKYRFPVLTSWDYGWRLGDVVMKEELKNPIYGRNRVIHETFYRRNGISELPLHGGS